MATRGTTTINKGRLWPSDQAEVKGVGKDDFRHRVGPRSQAWLELYEMNLIKDMIFRKVYAMRGVISTSVLSSRA